MAIISGTSRADSLVGTEFDDQIGGSLGDDTLVGGAGNDSLGGSSDNDLMFGGLGDDRLIGGTENDTMYGDEGNDSIAGQTGDDVGYGGDGNDTLLGDPGNDTFRGGAGNDELRGGQDADWMNGEAGDDLLAGSPGSDVFAFTYATDMGLDTIEDFTFGDGDRLSVDFDPALVTTRDTPQGLVLAYLGVDFLLLPGFTSGSFDLAWFMPLAVPIRDTVDVTPNVFYKGGATVGNDTVTGTIGNNLLNALDGDDSMQGLAGDDWIDGGRGHDTLRGGDGNDIVYGGVGVFNDSIFGDAGDDLVFAGYGDNRVDGGAGNDLVYGGPGRDLLIGGYGNDELHGEDGNDNVMGAQGNDLLFGGGGNDGMVGGAGRDTLVGGAGIDTLTGQADADLFVLSAAEADVVKDFSSLQGDKLCLQGVADLSAFLAGVTATDSAAGLVLAHDGQAFAVLAGVAAAQYSGNWFTAAPVFGAPAYPGVGISTNSAPVLTSTGVELAGGQIALASTLFTLSDANGDAPMGYEIKDLSTETSSGRLLLTTNGVESPIKAGIVRSVFPESVATLRVDEGLVSDFDNLWIRAFDGAGWSEWLPLS